MAGNKILSQLPSTDRIPKTRGVFVSVAKDGKIKADEATRIVGAANRDVRASLKPVDTYLAADRFLAGIVDSDRNEGTSFLPSGPSGFVTGTKDSSYDVLVEAPKSLREAAATRLAKLAGVKWNGKPVEFAQAISDVGLSKIRKSPERRDEISKAYSDFLIDAVGLPTETDGDRKANGAILDIGQKFRTEAKKIR